MTRMDGRRGGWRARWEEEGTGNGGDVAEGLWRRCEEREDEGQGKEEEGQERKEEGQEREEEGQERRKE